MSRNFFKQRTASGLLLLLCALALLPGIATAAVDGAGTILQGAQTSANLSGIDTKASGNAGAYFSAAIGRALNIVFTVMGAIFMTVILIGGYKWMTAGGNEENVKKAKEFIVNGINGMIVMFMAYALVYIIFVALNAATNGGMGGN